MEWRDEGIVIGLRRHGESSGDRRGDDARARPPSRPRARRPLEPHARGAAAGQFARPRLARAARRASRRLRRRAARPARGPAAAERDWRSRASAISARCCGCCPSAIRTRACSTRWRLIADHLDDPALAPALIARFEARMLVECGFALDLETCAVDRRARGSDLCLAEIRPRRQRERRRAVARQAAAAAGLPAARRERRRRTRATSRRRSG